MTDLLHVSDTHLGKRMYQSEQRREDFTKAFEAAVDIAIQEEVDAVIHTGDLFDDPNPNLPTINECADILKKLASEKIPLYVIVGNHERKLDDQWVDLMKRFDLVERLSTTPTMVGGFALYGVDAIRGKLSTADLNLEPPEDENATRILCMHELVQPIVQENRGADYHITDILNQLPFTPDGIALGDYHAHEEREINGCSVFYPGPTERTKVNENPGTVLLLSTDSDERNLEITKKYISNVDPNTPREFESRVVEIGGTQGIEVVEEQLDNIEAKHEDISEVAVVLTLTGEYNDVSTSDVYELMDDYGIRIQNVLDKRAVSSTEIDVDVEELGNSLDSLGSIMGDAEEDVDTHDAVDEVIEVIGDDDFPKNRIREDARQKLENGFTGDLE